MAWAVRRRFVAAYELRLPRATRTGRTAAGRRLTVRVVEKLMRAPPEWVGLLYCDDTGIVLR